MKKLAGVLPFDPAHRTVLLVRSTNWHPSPGARHKIKLVGGFVEEGEEPFMAALRELEEEFPGWWIRTPGTSRKFGNPPVEAKGGLHHLYTGSTDRVELSVYCMPADLGVHASRLARRVGTESHPEVWDLSRLPEEGDLTLPLFAEPLAALVKLVEISFPT